jgi:hypothetical protein
MLGKAAFHRPRLFGVPIYNPHFSSQYADMARWMKENGAEGLYAPFLATLSLHVSFLPSFSYGMLCALLVSSGLVISIHKGESGSQRAEVLAAATALASELNVSTMVQECNLLEHVRLFLR